MDLKSNWIALFNRAASGTKEIRNLLTPLGAALFIGFIAGLVFLSFRLDHWLKLPGLIPRPWHLIVSLPLLAIGLFLIGWSVLHFVKSKGTPVPFNPPPELVQSGPYAHTRNPMLSGVFFLMFGLGIFSGSPTLVFFFTPLFIGINTWELKAIEEPELEKRLGQAYLAYRQKTPMFIPRLSSGRKSDG